MNFTPRVIAAHLEFCNMIDKAEAAMALALNTMAARGDEKKLKAQLKELSRE